MEQEIWKDIPGYEGYYMVSNLGRVKGLDRILFRRHKGKIVKVTYGGMYIKASKSCWGYTRVGLNKDGINKSINIHRLVALAFIPQVDGKEQVNHKDGDKKNNTVDNLEWCTGSENQRHRYDVLKQKSKLGKQIVQMDINGNCIRIWDCMNDISRELGFSQGNISNYCRGKRKVGYGYIWEFKN